MISVLMGLSGASGAVVARYVGAHDRVNANLAVLQAVILKVLAAGSLVFGGFLVGAGLRLPEESAEG